ncbi:MAG: hypothetical protein AB7T07_11695 [Steroidobacteraceae bacterium]
MAALYWIYANISPHIYAISWLWILLEILHYIGLCLLLGALFLMDVRLLGFNRRLPLGVINDLVPLVYIGFGLNLITGLIFYLGNPVSYTLNPAFQVKMLLILIAGFNGVFYRWKIYPQLAAWDRGVPVPLYAKSVGALSLFLWLIVVYCGRVIPYVG